MDFLPFVGGSQQDNPQQPTLDTWWLDTASPCTGFGIEQPISVWEEAVEFSRVGIPTFRAGPVNEPDTKREDWIPPRYDTSKETL